MGSHISKLNSKRRHSRPEPPVPLPARLIQRFRGSNLYTRLQNLTPVRSLLTRLPNELLLEIAKSLDTARDLYALRRVNRRLAVLVYPLLSDYLLRAYHKSATRSLLLSAPTHYSESLVLHLSRLGVDLNTIDCDCSSTNYCRCRPALHHAILNSNKVMVRTLLRHGARINAPYNHSGDNAVHLAIDTIDRNSGYFRIPRNADLAILEMLLSGGGLQTMNDPASLNSIGVSWLNLAVRRCRDNDMRIVKQFLSSGLSVDVADQEQSLTPLHIAVWNNLVEVATALLMLGADHRTVDWRGTTPFGTACNRPNCALIDLLLRHDATLIDEVVSERGETVELHFQRGVERMMCHEDAESDYSDYYQVEIATRQKMLAKLKKLAETRRNSSMTDSLLQMYYNSL